MPMPAPSVSMLGVSMRATPMNYKRTSARSARSSRNDELQDDQRDQGEVLSSTRDRRLSARGTGTSTRGEQRSTRRDRRGRSSASASHLSLVEQRRGKTGSTRTVDRRRTAASERDLGQGQDSQREEFVSRPAVYTADAPAGNGVLDRLRGRESSRPSARASARRDSAQVVESYAPARRLHMPPLPVILLLGISIALGVVILMGPARMYYAAWRDEGILEAQYEVVAAQYDDLSHDIERLQTLEGIEDLARRRGYAYPDEKALVVRELEEQEFVGPVSLEDAIEEHEKNLPWYVGMLDAFFDYHYE